MDFLYNLSFFEVCAIIVFVFVFCIVIIAAGPSITRWFAQCVLGPIADYCCGYSDWVKNSRLQNYHAKMKIKMIKTIYNLNPDRWSYSYAYSCKGLFEYRDNKGHGVVIYTSYWGYIWLNYKYKKYLKNKKKTQKIQEEKKGLSAVLVGAQTDIDKLKKESQRQIELAEKVTKKVQKNMEVK